TSAGSELLALRREHCTDERKRGRREAVGEELPPADEPPGEDRADDLRDARERLARTESGALLVPSDCLRDERRQRGGRHRNAEAGHRDQHEERRQAIRLAEQTGPDPERYESVEAELLLAQLLHEAPDQAALDERADEARERVDVARLLDVEVEAPFEEE